MTYIHKDAVQMGAVASNKQEALMVVADALHQMGLVSEDYLIGLIARENMVSTYLGQGISIPHGTPDYKDKVKQTGVALVHFADGVSWGDDAEMVYLAVGIAAKSDEHLTVLRTLTQALGQDGIDNALKNAKHAEEVVGILTGDKSSLTNTQNQTNSLSSVVHSSELYLSKSLIDLNVKGDMDDLLYRANDLLKQANCVQTGFLTDLTTDKMVRMNDGVFVITSDKSVKKSAVAFVGGQVFWQAEPLKLLVVVAHNEGVDEDRLSVLLDDLMGLDNGQYYDKVALADALDINPYKDWLTAQVVLANRHGLHARPATYLSNVAKAFEGEVMLSVADGEPVSAKSLTKLLSLGVGYAQTLSFLVEPQAGANDALNALVNAVNEGLGETVTPIKSTSTISVNPETVHEPLKLGEKMYGIGASKGVCVAKAIVVKNQLFDYVKHSDNPSHEREVLESAIHTVKIELTKTIGNARNEDIAKIFTAHLMLLDDPELLEGVEAGIDNGLSAPMAWDTHINSTAKKQAALENRLLAQRAADLLDVGQRVLRVMCGDKSQSTPNEPYVLIKDDLLPSDVAGLNNEQVAGIVTAFGGASSHSAIVARSLGIPAIVGAGLGVLDIEQNTQVLVNATKGWYMASPDEGLIKQSLIEKAGFAQKLAIAKEHALEPAITLDDKQIEVAVNLGDVEQALSAVASGAEAVGLLRTELVFMKHVKMPDVDTQVADYQKVFDALAGKPVVVRTLDIGGDKPLPYLAMNHEENPFLGVRGIRLTLQKPQMLKDQLTALLKASNNRPLRIMFPMVGRFEEWRAARGILDDLLATYPQADLQVGIMVEVPSVAVMADKFAPFVDFFSIGTNDLTQYALAIDRGHPTLSAHADGLHPSVLRLIDMTVKAAHQHGKWVGVCGELGADTQAVPILLGLGVDELSVSSASIALLKAQIRTLKLTECQKLAKLALECSTATQVRELVGE